MKILNFKYLKNILDQGKTGEFRPKGACHCMKIQDAGNGNIIVQGSNDPYKIAVHPGDRIIYNKGNVSSCRSYIPKLHYTVSRW